jgi:hypothetical protein
MTPAFVETLTHARRIVLPWWFAANIHVFERA